MQNAETSCSKCRDFMPKHYAQNIDVMLKVQRCPCMLKGRNVQKFRTRSYTELRTTAGQQTVSDQLCCMTDHFSKI